MDKTEKTLLSRNANKTGFKKERWQLMLHLNTKAKSRKKIPLQKCLKEEASTFDFCPKSVFFKKVLNLSP